MNKEDVVNAVAEKTGGRRADILAVLNAFQTVTMDAICRGDKVTLSGFGTFELRSRATRLGRNPHTKEAVEIPARTLPAFIPSVSFKEKVCAAGQKKD